ncbi:SLC13 family permease [Deinococcus sonorensis]|uniref:SLC13 family permease n=2 Tax=Deinococcus sonorensis TaxID=309891 RepID=A0AAU7UAM0_9DEIO
MDPVTVVLILFVAALVLFATEWLRVDVTALLLLSALLLFGLTTPKDAFANFGSDTVLTIASLFILTRALLRTGVIEDMGNALARRARNAGGMARGLLSVVAGLSAFTSNTATTAVFLPLVVGLSRRAQLPPSRLLMPLAYASILGGTITVIGTTTNLVVSGALPRYHIRPLGFFELAWVGLPVALIGLAYLFFVAPRLLPEREAELAEGSQRPYLAELTVQPESVLAGQTLRDSGLGRDHGLTVVAIRQGEQLLHGPDAGRQLHSGDVLVLEGSSERLLAGKDTLGLVSKPEQKLRQVLSGTSERPGDVRLVEAVVLPRSRLLGRTLRESRFRERYGASVLALHRRNRVSERLARTRVQVGDVLLLQGPADRLSSLGEDLTVLDDLTERHPDRRKARLALLLFLGAVVIGASGLLPLGVSVLVAVALTFAFQVLTPEEGYQAIEWPVLVLVACMLTFGGAFEASGAAKVIIGVVAGVVKPLGAYGLLTALFVVTVALTQPMSNQAAALVMLPLAIGISAQLGYDPRPFIIGITVAASNSFITPLEPSCMLVFGPGRYRFFDFVRVGSGLTLVTLAASVMIIPLVWPFQP